MKPMHLVAAVAIAVGVAALPVAADDYPSKPIKIVVSFTAGGTTDVIARQVAVRLSQHLKQAVVVENRPGAGGTLGTDVVARAPADGYTLLMSSSGPIVISPSLSKKLATDPLTEIAPIIPVADVPNVLVVYPGIAARSVPELVKLAKAAPGTLNYGSTGVGTVAHLSGAMFTDRTGIEASHIPYKGADAVTDLMSGRIQFMFATLPSVIGQIRAGKLVPIATVADKRSKALPDVPTLKEAGMPELEGAPGAWFGLFAPKATPSAIVAKLNATVNEILRESGLQEGFEQQGAEPMGGSPEQFARKLQRDYEAWKPVVKRSGASSD
jgi:tripartite-type tricarboxylate transporter receptor subunit TctC